MGNEEEFLSFDFSAGVFEHLHQVVIFYRFIIKNLLVGGYHKVAQTGEVGGVEEILVVNNLIIVSFS